MGRDQGRGGLADRQAPVEAVGLEVAVDEHGCPIVVAGQAVVGQIADLLRPAPGVNGKLDAGALEFKDPEKASGNSVRQVVTVKQGIDQALAKKIVKAIKDAKLKVQAAIQGDELRVSGKKRDDLQEAIALVKGLKIEQPLQYVNFRD